ncbi:MAG: type II secretion system F family protein [Candidatus Dormibacteraeota bacterium]|nr:type II secretion system F family protein [Candidatus Dormibacteraeota bacterium]
MAQVARTTTQRQGKSTFADSIRAFLSFTPGRAKPQVVVLFCRQLSSFVRVGVPVTTAIQTFAEQATNSLLRTTYYSIASDLQRGVRLSDAIAAHPRVFPRIVADMVRSAEATGNLDTVLVQAARHIEREASARSKIKAAMTYPLIIFTFALLIAVGIVVFVLPKFRDLYKSLGVETPGILNALLGFSGFVTDHALLILLGILLAVVAIGVWVRTEDGHLFVDRVLLQIPVINALLRASMTEQFCRTLADMLGAGVPISQTYAVTINNVRNRVYRRALGRMGPAIASGQGIYRPLQQTNVFAPAAIQLIRVGEETGHLDTNLAEAAVMYEEEIDYRIKRLTAFVEPAMIMFVGLIVGFVAITLITSIYSLAGGFK